MIRDVKKHNFFQAVTGAVVLNLIRLARLLPNFSTRLIMNLMMDPT